ncbi:MAG: extracellular solute-binding protein, partial [Candidatus Nanopelagicaceae bacterium]
VFAYSPERVSTLPSSYEDMTDPEYKGRFGIAPTNSSFQAFVTALRLAIGEVATEEWLRALIANEPRYYEKNSMIVEAIENGEIDLGLVNHYYIYEVAKALGREISVKDGFFADGDLGNMINVSGAALLATSTKRSEALSLIEYLLRPSTQERFVSETKEYALLDGLAGPQGLPALSEIAAPSVDLNALRDLKATQSLLIKVGLL